MEDIYEALVLEKYTMDDASVVEKKLDWLLVRRARVGNLGIACALPKSASSKVAAVLKNSRTQLQSLDFFEDAGSVESILPTLFKYCNQLKVLRICDIELSAKFGAWLGSLHNLQELTFVQMEDDFEVEGLSGISCPSVLTLTLDGTFDAQAQSILLKMCPDLINYSILFLNACDFSDLPSTVRSIDMFSCSTPSFDSFHPNVTKLKLRFCYSTDDTFARIFASCANLQELDVQEYSQGSDTALRLIGDTYGPRLQVLTLRHNASFTLDAMRYLCEKCKELKSLSLLYFDHTYIASALQNCRTLDISNAKVTNELMMQISTTAVENLTMCHATGFTEKGFMTLINGCKSLKLLTINDECVTLLVLLLCKALRPQLHITVE